MNHFRIFHIDDHLLFRDSLNKILEEHHPNTELYSFINADKALAYILGDLSKGNKIDLIVTDFTHIGSDGIEFAQKLRMIKAKYRIKIPVLLLTMREENEEILDSLNRGLFDAYIPKSVTTNQLLTTIEKLLPNQVQRREQER